MLDYLKMELMKFVVYPMNEIENDDEVMKLVTKAK